MRRRRHGDRAVPAVSELLALSTTFVCQARAIGRAHGVGGVAYGRCFDGNRENREPVAAGFELTITLPAMQSLRVQPPGAYAVAIVGRADGRLVRCAGGEGPLFLRTDAGGVVDLPLGVVDKVVRLARLQRDGEPPIWSVVTSGGLDSVVSAAAKQVRVAVTDAIGNPARGQHVVMIPWVGDRPGIEVPLPLDAAARASVRVTRGAWFFWCCNGVDAAWRVVDLAAADVEVALALRPIARATLRFVDAAGTPRRGFRVKQWPSFEWDAKPSVENRFLIERQIGLACAQMPHDVTDGDGCLQYLMLPLPEARLHFGGGMGGLGGPRPGGIEAGTRTDHVIE